MASCKRFYKLTCYRNREVEDSECCGGTKVGHKYLNGIEFSSGGKQIVLLERPYNVSDIGDIITIRDSYGEEFTFKTSQTKYSKEEIIQILNDCNFCGEVNDYVQSVNPGVGIAIDDTDPAGPIVGLNQASQNAIAKANSAVQSVTGSDGVEVDNTDPQNPITKLTQASKDSLAKADSAVQSGDLADVATSGEFGDLLNVPDFIEDSEKGVPGGVAELDGSGHVLSSQLPSYVDDVVEVANYASLPVTGESGKIYITIDDNLTYRWSGSTYVLISSSLALGETSSTAYRGDRGKIAYDHSQVTSGNPHNVTAADVGLGNVDNTSDADKPVSTAQGQAINQAVTDAKQYTDDEITALNLGTASQADTGDFIASTEKGAANGVAPLGADQKVPNQYLPAIAISEVIEATENDIATFAANSASYTFQTGDVIIIDDGSGNVQHYQYRGGIKTDVNEYSLINATQVDWDNVTGKPTDLEDNLFTKDLTLTADRTHQLNNHGFKITGGANFPNSIMFQLWDGGFEYRNLYVWDTEIGVSVATTDNKSAGFVARANGPSDVSLQIRTGQLFNALSSLDVYLKRVDGFGNVQFGQLEIPEYASDTDANNDSDLIPGAPYYVTGEEVVKVKGLVSGPVAKNLFTEDLTLTGNRTHDLGDNEFVMSGEEGSIEMAFNVGTDKQGVLYVDHEQVKINSRGTGSYWSGFRAQNFNGAPVLEISTGQGTLPSNSKYLQRVDQYGLVEYGQIEIPEYASDAAADADANLASGAPYSITGSRQVKTKSSASPFNPSYGYQTLTDAANISWDMDLGEMAEVTLGDNRTLDNPTNLKQGTYSLLVKQDANGGRTLGYGTAFKWPGGIPPDLTSDPNAVDLLTFVSDGTNLYGAITSDYS